MEVRARLRNVRMSPRKARLVADLVRRRGCGDALNVLESSSKRAARPIGKLIRSAIANAQQHNEREKAGIDLDNLYVKRITVDEAARMWRIRPRAMGRAAWIKKPLAHVTVILDER